MSNQSESEKQEPVGKLKVTLEDRPIDIELAQYKRMFEAACSALGEVSEALGCDPNEGGSEPLIAAIERLKSSSQEPIAWMVYTLDGKSAFVTDNPTDFTDEHRALPLYTHLQPKREPLTEWKPIETAPKDTEVLLYCNKFIPLYIGKKRYGCLGEPQQDEFEWRCSSSGRFANPTYWMPLPKSPIEAAYGIKE